MGEVIVLNTIKEMSVNEKGELLLQQIDELKSIFAGRDNSFMEYTHNGFRYSDVKTNDFICCLIEILKDRYVGWGEALSNNAISFYSAFYKFVILLCDIQCRKSDMIFESFIKLSKNISKPAEGKSVYDILIDDINNEAEQKPEYSDEIALINSCYQTLNTLYEGCYDQYFESNIRYSINTFLDGKHLSFYIDDDKFARGLQTMQSAKRRLRSIKTHMETDKNE